MADPLHTRSLPGALWGKIPKEWVAFDEELQDKISQSIDPQKSPWKELQWLTENPLGLTLSFSFLIAISLYHLKNRGVLNQNSLRGVFSVQWFWKKLLVIAIFAGLSDTISNFLKRVVGRLKPHVTFYNTFFLPALSLPSNHAFNSSFLWALLYFSVTAERRHKEKVLFSLGLLLVFLVGISRVLFGQH